MQCRSRLSEKDALRKRHIWYQQQEHHNSGQRAQDQLSSGRAYHPFPQPSLFFALIIGRLDTFYLNSLCTWSVHHPDESPRGQPCHTYKRSTMSDPQYCQWEEGKIFGDKQEHWAVSRSRGSSQTPTKFFPLLPVKALVAATWRKQIGSDWKFEPNVCTHQFIITKYKHYVLFV